VNHGRVLGGGKYWRWWKDRCSRSARCAASALFTWNRSRPCFPEGNAAGRRKIRAMEIIEELEPHPPRTYGGAVGISVVLGQPRLLCINIRTLSATGTRLGRGGRGIVAIRAQDPEGVARD